MLEVTLNCRFDDFELVVEQVIPSNQIIGLFGASGSGKSRFIRQLLGFDRVNLSSGQILFNQECWIDSESNSFTESAQRGIGYLPQSIDLFPHLSAKENITFSINKTKRENPELDIDAVINALDIQTIADKYPSQLSGGQQQRVALARAIVGASQLLVLDEPLSAQGETHKAQIMCFLRSLNSEQQLPIIFASHDRVEQAYLSQYLLTFNDGKIDQSGCYDEIATDINGEFSQTIDAINRITATVSQFDEAYYLNELKTATHIIWAGDVPILEKTLVVVEVKAQDISLSLNKHESSSILNCLSVKIIDFSEIARHQYLIKLAFEDTILTTFITKKSFIELELEKDLQLYARFKSVSVKPISLTAS